MFNVHIREYNQEKLCILNTYFFHGRTIFIIIYRGGSNIYDNIKDMTRIMICTRIKQMNISPGKNKMTKQKIVKDGDQ